MALFQQKDFRSAETVHFLRASAAKLEAFKRSRHSTRPTFTAFTTFTVHGYVDAPTKNGRTSSVAKKGYDKWGLVV